MAILNYGMDKTSGGIYAIFNSKKWRLYIGSTFNFKKRWELAGSHLWALRKQKHHNKFLQADYNSCLMEYGDENFLEFHILEEMPFASKQERLTREEHYIDIHFSDRQRCYNALRNATSPEGCQPPKGANHHNYGRKMTDKQKKLISEIWKGKKRGPQSEEHLKKLSEKRKGRKPSKESLEKAKITRKLNNKPKRKGFTISEEQKIIISKLHTGKKVSDETKKKQSKAKIGKPIHENTRNASIKHCEKTYTFSSPECETVTFTNLKKFCKANNLGYGSMSMCATGRKESYKGWIFVNKMTFLETQEALAGQGSPKDA